MFRSLVIALAALAGACSNWEAASKPPPKIELKQDLYCEIAEKVRWDIRDTPETIRQNVRENRKYDRLCKGPVS